MVTGKVVQPARVYMGDAVDSSTTTTNWDLALTVAPGVHDLFAFSADHVLVHHALDATHNVALGTIDIVTAGTVLDTVAFSAINKTATEVLTSRAAIETPTTSFAAVTRPGDASATKVIPESLLVATDRQSVSVIATDGGHERALRQPYHAGGSTEYTLPSLLTGVSWTTTANPVLHWNTLATVTAFSASVLSESTNTAQYNVSATWSYLTTTGVDQITFDTSIPGFQAAWKVDLTQPYRRSVIAQYVPATSTVETETYADELDAR